MALSLKEKLIYSSGQLGIALLQAMHMVYLVYFFFPPKTASIPYLIPQTSLFIGITILGLIMSISRIFDAITDPLIASLTDNSKHPRGKSVPVMQKAALPFALSFVLVFYVPHSDGIHIANIIWLSIFMIVSAFSLTLYMIPYHSLLITMAKTSHDKIDLGTYGSLFWFLGLLMVTLSSSFWRLFSVAFNISTLVSIRLTFVVIGALAFIFLMIPSLFIRETKYSRNKVLQSTKQAILPSLRHVLRHRDYVYYLISFTAYTIATYMFETGLIYFITVLAKEKESLLGPLTVVIGVLTLLSYPLINKWAKVKGKKSLFLVAFSIFTATFLFIFLLNGQAPFTYIILSCVVLLVPLPQAIFTILPFVIGADCANYDYKTTGVDRAGMYVAASGFVTKLGSSLAMILFTSFLLLGKDIDHDLGIRLAVLFGGVISIVGLLFMRKYNEKKIIATSQEVTSKRNEHM